MSRPPSGVPDRKYSGYFRRRDTDYCRDLREHVAEFRETRRRLAGALIVVFGLSIAAFVTGNTGIAGFLLGAGLIVSFFAVFNEVVLGITSRKLDRDCPEFDPPRDIA